MRLLKTRPYDFLVLTSIVIYGIVFSHFTVLKHEVLQSSGWDLGVFDQALYTTLYSGKFLYYTADLFLNPSGCYFAQHISPILFLILPFYAINSSAITLLVLKSFILAFGALPLYLLTKELLESPKASFMVAIIYLLYAPLHGANWFDFQPQVFLPVLFFSMFYFAVKAKWLLYFPTVTLAAMVEEHITIFIFLAAVYLLVTSKVRPFWASLKSFRNMNRNLASVITMVFSVIYFFVAGWIKNSFQISSQFMDVYKATHVFSVLGVRGDPITFPFYVLSHPQSAFTALLYDLPLKFLFLVLLFGPLLFFSFKSKLVLVTAPFLALFLLSNYDGYYSVGAHYPLYILAFIFVAALFVLRRLQNASRIPILRTMLITSLLFTICISPLSPLSAPFVKEGLLWYPNTSLASNENIESLVDLVNVVPPNASILTQNVLFPHVSNRLNAYILPISSVMNNTEYIRFLLNSSEYVLIDLTWQDFNSNFVLNEIAKNNSYGIYALARNAVLFKRGFQGEPLFVHYADYQVLSAYRDLATSSFTQIIPDSSAISERVVFCPKSQTGDIIFGPYRYLIPGSYEVTFTIKAGEHNDSRVGWCDIMSNFSNYSVSKRDIFGFELQSNTWSNLTLAFTSTKLLTAVEFRLSSYGTADIYVDRVIMKRTSPNATSDFGVRTFGSPALSLISGYVSSEGFLVYQQNTASNGFWCGPYISLPAGKYRATVLLRVSPTPQEPLEHILTLSVSANSGRDIYAKYEVTASDFLNKNPTSDWQQFTLDFIATGCLEGVEFTGLAPSSDFTISLAYILIEKLALTPDQNYALFSVQRGLDVDAGQIISDPSSNSGEVALSRKGVDEGILIYGPYITLPSGTYEAVFRIKAYETSQNASVRFEVISQPNSRVLSQTILVSSKIHDGEWFNVTLPFSLEALTRNIEFRVSSNGMTNLNVDTVTVIF